MLPPKATDQAIYSSVRRDLAPRAIVVHGKIGAAVAFGGLVSLFLCGQFGIGLSNAAAAMHSIIMSHFGMSGCALICGTLFSIVPVGLLRLIAPPLQFRHLMRHRFGVHVFWTTLFGAALAGLSGRVSLTSDLPLWFAAAVVSMTLLERLVDRLASLLASQDDRKAATHPNY